MNAQVSLIRNKNDLRAIKQCVRLNEINERLNRVNTAIEAVLLTSKKDKITEKQTHGE